MKTVVLTSRENFVWLSMQEIIPFIERSWQASAGRGHEVECLNVDEHPLSKIMPVLLSADTIVLSCFTVRLCKLAELLRSRLACEARFVIYLHNQATIACWPFHEWGLGKLLREDDVFVSSSRPDAETMAHSFTNARVVVLPFTLPDLRTQYAVAPRAGRIPFVYVGRVSAQKNLHTLIYALRLLRGAEPQLDWRFHLYGTDDNLGSPNMGMPSRRYGSFLRKLVRKLDLTDRVVFAGFCERETLNRRLGKQRYIAVSASLHSDENFGMAQFRALCHGNLAALTAWGGYSDFRKHFGERVFLSPVSQTSRGPSVDPSAMMETLRQAALAYRAPAPRRVRVPTYYREDRIAQALRKLGTEKSSPKGPLQPTPIARRVLRQRARFAEHATQIFSSYADVSAQPFFRGYRMGEVRKMRARPLTQHCHPWVTLRSRTIEIQDPHRGALELPLSSKGPVTLTDWFGVTRKASRETAAKLFALGYSHESERP